MRNHAINSSFDDGKSPRTTLLLDLIVRSPIHIGTREGKLGPTEFVFDSGKVYVVDEKLLGLFLKERNLIHQFMMEVAKGPFRLATFLRDVAKSGIRGDLAKISSKSIQGGDQSMQDFRPFLRDGSGTVYIPGTSIKGTLRTALLYRILKQDQKLLKSVTSRIDSDPPDFIKKHRRHYSAEWLQKKGLQCFTLPSSKQGPSQDILRCLAVRDAYPLGDVRTQVIDIKFLCKRGNGDFYWSQDKKHGKDLVIWLEAVVEGTFRLELIWDNWLFQQFQKNNPERDLPLCGLDDLLEAVRQMNSDLFHHEIDFYSHGTVSHTGSGPRAAAALKRWYENPAEDSLRVGFGSGMLSTTVGLNLSEALRQKIRDSCGSGPRKGDPAPKSRRVWVRTNTEVLPLGWFSFKEAEPSLAPVRSRFGTTKNTLGKNGVFGTGDTTNTSARTSQGRGHETKEPQALEIWNSAEVRWNKGRDEVQALSQGKRAIGRGRDLYEDPDTRNFLEAQRKDKPFKARVTVEVVTESYRRIVKVVPPLEQAGGDSPDPRMSPSDQL